MSMIEGEDQKELSGRWRSDVVLKRDVFSTIERGRFRTEASEVEAVLRRIDGVPWWSGGLAHLLFRRERRALAIAGPLGIAPPLLWPASISSTAAASRSALRPMIITAAPAAKSPAATPLPIPLPPPVTR